MFKCLSAGATPLRLTCVYIFASKSSVIVGFSPLDLGMYIELTYEANRLYLYRTSLWTFNLDPLQGHLKENQEDEQGGGEGGEAGSAIVAHADWEQVQR